MFLTLLKYRFKITVRDWGSLFWFIFWPVILATFFHFAFSNLLSNETFTNIDIALVNPQKNETFVNVLEEMDMFNITSTDLNTAELKLKDKEITGYIIVDKDKNKVIVNDSGVNETILKTVLDKYEQVSQSYSTLIESNPEILKTQFIKEFDINTDYFKSNDKGNMDYNFVLIYFYTIIAMVVTCAATRGIDDICSIQANQLKVGARLSISPARKMLIYLSYFIISLVSVMLSVTLVFLYLIFILHVDFGEQIGYIFLLCLVGTIASLFIGSLIGTIKKSMSFKISLGVTFSLVGCFLSGMMAPAIKIFVQEKAPVLAYINPSNLITDGLYSLYYYGVGNRYFVDLIALAIISVIFGIITLVILRRQKYASI